MRYLYTIVANEDLSNINDATLTCQECTIEELGDKVLSLNRLIIGDVSDDFNCYVQVYRGDVERVVQELMQYGTAFLDVRREPTEQYMNKYRRRRYHVPLTHRLCLVYTDRKLEKQHIQ